MPSMLTAMRWEDLSIWTATPARAGLNVNADMTIAAASVSRPPTPHFVVTPRRPKLLLAA